MNTNVNVKISVVVATRNRRQVIPQCLDALMRQSFPAEQYEIIVVDNGTDGAGQWVLENYSKFSKLKVLEETQSGLSKARNIGWKNAAGDYIAYVDDDAAAEAHWLENIVRRFDADASLACVGGPVQAVFEVRPVWLTDFLVPYYSSLDWGGRSFCLSKDQWIVGANMAFRRSILEKTGGFWEELKCYGDDTYMLRKISQSGGKVFYDAGVRVRHFIFRDRIDRRWLLKKWFWEGAATALLDIHFRKMGPGRRFAAVLKQIWNVPGMILKRFTRRPGGFHQNTRLVISLGYTAGMLGYRR